MYSSMFTVSSYTIIDTCKCRSCIICNAFIFQPGTFHVKGYMQAGSAYFFQFGWANDGSW